MSSLPDSQTIAVDSSTAVKTFFDSYFLQQISFASNEIDAVIGFFQKRGFDQDAAQSTAISILTQAKFENIKPFAVIDTLKGLTDVQLSRVVTEVLNTKREATSALGYSLPFTANNFESRNIRP
jgi:hypothetical protein